MPKLSSWKGLSLVGSVMLIVVLGIGAALKVTVDHLLYWDATGSVESWARYVAENVTDIDRIAEGEPPSAASMAFLIRTQHFRHVFGFEIIDLKGRVQLASDGSKITRVGGSIDSPIARHAAQTHQQIVSIKRGTPPVRPLHFAEAYLPVSIGAEPVAIVAAYVDLSEHHQEFTHAFLWAACALCLLGGLGAGLPTYAWHKIIKQKEEADQRIRYLAHHDGLTGLSNRVQLLESLDAALSALQQGSTPFALHFIDFDHFKAINDTLGHDGGDFLLMTAAQRLRRVSREGDVVCRFGGDEFVVLQANVASRADAEGFANRMMAAVSEPIPFRGSEIFATFSLGFALAPDDADAADPLLKCADLAVYQAKADGRNCVRSFHPDMDETQKIRMDLEKAIRDAARRDGFLVRYQPVYATGPRRLMGFEALLLLPRADGTFDPPEIFLSAATEMRLMNRIGMWAVREACRTAAAWPDHLILAMNICGAQFEVPGFARQLREILDECGLAPRRLELEIIEGLLLRKTTLVMAELRSLKDMGVRLVMDEVGRGNSSLSHLWRFPFDKIKVDRGFMAGVGSSRAPDAVARSIVLLGRELGMQVAVEDPRRISDTDRARHVQEAPDAVSPQVADTHAQAIVFGRLIEASEIAGYILAELHGGPGQPSAEPAGEGRKPPAVA